VYLSTDNSTEWDTWPGCRLSQGYGLSSYLPTDVQDLFDLETGPVLLLLLLLLLLTN
jgi:hypothetical protein